MSTDSTMGDSKANPIDLTGNDATSVDWMALATSCHGCLFDCVAQRDHMGHGGCTANPIDITGNAATSVDWVALATSCHGCLFDCAAQRNHMGHGGCMAPDTSAAD
jgi:hypothetical protein